MRATWAVVAGVLWAGPAWAQVTGTFEVAGQNPDGSKYSGSVSVEPTGETYRVVWSIQGTRFVGTGIGDRDFIAITYRAGNATGIALMGVEGQQLKGVWSYSNGRKLGAEVWTRR